MCIYIYIYKNKFQKVAVRREAHAKEMFQLVDDINVALLFPAIKHAIKTIHICRQYAYLLLKET